jgi:fatty acid desaturase
VIALDALRTSLAGARPGDAPPGDYQMLRQRVERAGLLERRPGYYGLKIGLTIAGLLLGWAAFFLVGNAWATLAVAALLAFLSTQVVFLGHDAGHRQISGSRRVNRLVGLVAGNALTGLSFGWWVPKHNAHHAFPNQAGRDPDIGGGLTAFAVSPEAGQCGSLGSRVRSRTQGWIFVGVLMLQGVGLHVTSVQSVLRGKRRETLADGLLLAANAAVYLGIVFWVLSPLKALLFIAVQQGLFGLYLGSTFAPNHKGMPVLERETTLPFLLRQVGTARNVVGGRFTTLIYGGLNFQIEHHLFPAMPRPNLARAQPIVEAFCAEHRLPYRKARPIASYRQAVRGASLLGGAVLQAG